MPQVSRELLLAIGGLAGAVLLMAGLGFLLSFVIKRAARANRVRYDETKAAAAAYGLHPPGRVYLDALQWLRHLPDDGQGQITKMFTGQRGGRPVAVAEYLYAKPTYQNAGGTGRLWVAVVQAPGPLPPRQGPGRYGTWYTAGTDLAVHADGRLEFPFVLGALDELLGVAGQFTA